MRGARSRAQANKSGEVVRVETVANVFIRNPFALWGRYSDQAGRDTATVGLADPLRVFASDCTADSVDPGGAANICEVVAKMLARMRPSPKHLLSVVRRPQTGKE